MDLNVFFNFFNLKKKKKYFELPQQKILDPLEEEKMWGEKIDPPIKFFALHEMNAEHSTAPTALIFFWQIID